MSWFWLNMPLTAAFFGAWVGVPLWLVFKRPDKGTPLAVSPPTRTHLAAPAEPQATPVPQGTGHLAGV